MSSFFNLTLFLTKSPAIPAACRYLCATASRAIVSYKREGKSGQHRATHRLTAGFLKGNEKVPQKITSVLRKG
jgi:hypothetical protein